MPWQMLKPTDEQFATGTVAIAAYKCNICGEVSPYVAAKRPDGKPITKKDMKKGTKVAIRETIPKALASLGWWHEGTDFRCPKHKAN